MPQRKKASTAFVHNLGLWATGEADLTSIRPDTPDDPDYESILALSEGSETASEDNIDPESDIEAIQASMKLSIKFSTHNKGAETYWRLKELRCAPCFFPFT